MCDRQTVENKEIKKSMRGEIEGQVERGMEGSRGTSSQRYKRQERETLQRETVT